MNNIYIAVAYGGEWEDRWERNIKAFSSREKAEAFCLHSKENIPEYSEYLERLTLKIGGFAHLAARKVGDLSDDPLGNDEYWCEYDRVYNTLLIKMDKKYPNLTADKDDCDVSYRVEVVEYEQ